METGNGKCNGKGVRCGGEFKFTFLLDGMRVDSSID